MEIDFGQGLENMDGDLLDLNLGTRVIEGASLGQVTIESLLAFVPGEMQQISGEEKAQRYELAMRIHGGKEGAVELKAEEIALIKKLVGQLFGPLVVGQVYRMLEGQGDGKGDE